MAAPVSDYAIDEEAFLLRDAMNSLLAKVISVYQSYNVPLPARRYWTIGDPVIDCEQLVISFVQMYLGSPGDEAVTPQPCNGPRTLVAQITVSRAQSVQPASRNPRAVVTPEQMQEDAEWAAIDAYILMDSLVALDLVEIGPPSMIATSSAQPEPSGGYQSVQTQLTMLIV